MRYLVISDIHSNWEALEAVLEDAAGRYDRLICCGDLVGYGADPNLVTEWSREHIQAVVRGNHDKACTGSPEVEWFNPAARASALWTRGTLTEENAGYLLALPRGPEPVDDFQILHGSPVDEDEYVVTEHDAAEIGPYLSVTMSFFGHTHIQGGFIFIRNNVMRLPLMNDDETEAVLELEVDRNYLLNPGSVGQPRDGDHRAAYLIYDSEDRLVAFRRVEYDIPGAQSKIIKAGLPEVLALRLGIGQ